MGIYSETSRAGRYSIALIAGFIAAAFAFIIFELVGIYLVREYRHLEAEIYDNNLEHLEQVLVRAWDGELKQLEHHASQIAPRDEFVGYIQSGESKNWFDTTIRSLTEELGALLNVSLVKVVSRSGQPVLTYDPSKLTVREEAIFEKLHGAALQGRLESGYAGARGRLFRVVAAPVTPTYERSTIEGVLFIATEVNQASLVRLEQLTGMSLSLRSEGSSIDGELWGSGVEARLPQNWNGAVDAPDILRQIGGFGLGVEGLNGKRLATLLAQPASVPPSRDVPSIYNTLKRYLPYTIVLSLYVGFFIGISVFAFLTVPLRKLADIERGERPVESSIQEVSLIADAIYRQQDEIKRGQNLQSSILASINEGFHLLDSRRKTIDVNPALCALVGCSRNKFFEEDLDPFFYLDQEGRSAAAEFFELLHTDDCLRRMGFDVGLEAASGPSKTIGIRFNVVPASEGDDYYVAVLVLDRSREKELDEQVRTSEKMRMLGEFAAGVAHNINNLLTGIVGAVSVMDSRVKKEIDPELQMRLLDSIRQAATRGANLTKELLQLSRIKDGRSTRYPVDVVKVINDVIAVVSSMESGRNFRFTVEGAEEPRFALCEEGGLHQVLLNIATNAVDACTDQREVSFTILRQQYLENDALAITVRDTGEGMTDEIAARIFEPFFSTKKAGKKSGRKSIGGSGLGLSSALALTRSWGGEITCASAPGKGTSFTITLPTVKTITDHGELNAPPQLSDSP